MLQNITFKGQQYTKYLSQLFQNMVYNDTSAKGL